MIPRMPLALLLQTMPMSNLAVHRLLQKIKSSGLIDGYYLLLVLL